MNLRYKTEANINKKSILSATKPDVKLSLTEETKAIKTRLKTKKNLKVYIEPETNKKFVEAAAAYALNLTNVRSIMVGEPRFKEIKEEVINKLKANDCEIEYITLPKKEKQKIQMFYEDNKCYINSAAAYALGYIDVTKFNMDDNLYGPLKEEELKDIKYNFEIEFQNINIKNENSKSNKK